MNLLYYIGFIILAFVLFEVFLRLLGRKPYRVQESFDISVEPGDKFLTRHPILGYANLPGRFKVTYGRNSRSFDATHLDNTLRITHPLDTYKPESAKREIWVFGCSFGYGWSVDDEDTYAWLLQEALPDYEVVNFSRVGYGTIHALAQLQEALKERKRPLLAVVAYGSFHDGRNIFSRNRRKILVTYNKLGPLVQPFARLDRKGRLRLYMADVVYKEWPLMRHSAFMHYLETRYNKIEEGLHKSHEVSKAIIKEISQLCLKNEIPFAVAGFWNDSLTSDMLEYCKKERIKTTDISIVLDDKTKNYPYDDHPSPLGHKKYAEKLIPFVRENL